MTTIIVLDWAESKLAENAQLLREKGYAVDQIVELDDLFQGDLARKAADYDLMIAHPNPHQLEYLCQILDAAFDGTGKKRFDVLYDSGYLGSDGFSEDVTLVETLDNKNGLKRPINLNYDNKFGFYFFDPEPSKETFLDGIDYLVGAKENVIQQ